MAPAVPAVPVHPAAPTAPAAPAAVPAMAELRAPAVVATAAVAERSSCTGGLESGFGARGDALRRSAGVPITER